VTSEVALDPALVAEAVQFLRASRLELEPRRQWPNGIDEAKGRIPKDEQLQVGRALGLLGDGGWGSIVQSLLRNPSAFCEPFSTGDVDKGAQNGEAELLAAVEALVRAWAPFGTGGGGGDGGLVTWVPSVARPALVEAVAARVAAALGVEAVPLVRRVRPMPPQADMANSASQLRNVVRAFGIVDPPEGVPVVLVDDVAESRWTLTVVGGQLIRAGSGPVFPFVLAKSGAG
jgi:ATP-dependent DNA helicase RecQ